MNIYEQNQIECSVCGKFIGEIDMGASIIFPLCSKCDKKEKRIIRMGIKKILVPVDITKKTTRALDAAIYLAKHLGSQITVMHSMPDIKFNRTFLVKDVLKEITNEAEKSIKRAKVYCENKHVVANHRITRGDEAESILRIAKKSQYDLIIMGSSGKGILKEFAFGSVSNYVMHNSNIPVLTVKENSPKLDTKINEINTVKPREKKIRRQGNGVPFSKMKKRASMK